jgi:hypothetical protein
MYPTSIKRLGHSPKLLVGCGGCSQAVPANLVWEPAGHNTSAAPRCSACLALAIWREILENAPAESTATAETRKRCERCLRRSRPTTNHFGFDLCQECKGSVQE